MSTDDENDVTAEITETTGTVDAVPGTEPAPDPATDTEPDAAGSGPETPETGAATAPTVSTARWVAAALAGLLVAALGLTAWLYFGVLRADQQLGAEAEQAVLAAAADGAVAVLTYSPQTLEKDFNAAKTHLTGDFLSYYTDFTEKVVTPAAKEKEVQTIAAVVRKGIISMRPHSAEVLIFLNQTTISKTVPDGSYSMSSVKVGLQKQDGRWLISSFDPV